MPIGTVAGIVRMARKGYRIDDDIVWKYADFKKIFCREFGQKRKGFGGLETAAPCHALRADGRFPRGNTETQRHREGWRPSGCQRDKA